MDFCKSVAGEEIQKHADQLMKFSNKLGRTKPSKKKEVNNMKVITKYLKKHDFRVNYDIRGMPGTFEAWYGLDTVPGVKRVNVAFLCRYDVTGKPQNPTGNHLVAEVAVAAAIGVKAALQVSSPPVGRVSVIGYPAQPEGGVATLVNLRVFQPFDVVLMAIPGDRTEWTPQHMARKTFQATYKKITALDAPPAEFQLRHVPLDACEVLATPWGPKKPPSPTPCDEKEVCMLAYQNVMAVQPQLDKDWKMRASYGRTCKLRPYQTTACCSTPSNWEMYVMEKRIVPCLEAAAKATGCGVEVRLAQKSFYSLTHNLLLAYMLQLNAYHCGTLVTPPVRNRPIRDATDVGNVSHVVPTLMPIYYVGVDANVGSEAFLKSLRTPTAHQYTIAIAKSLAMTVVDLFDNPVLMVKVKDELRRSLEDEKARSVFREFPGVLPKQKFLKLDVPVVCNVGWSKKV